MFIHDQAFVPGAQIRVTGSHELREHAFPFADERDGIIADTNTKAGCRKRGMQPMSACKLQREQPVRGSHGDNMITIGHHVPYFMCRFRLDNPQLAMKKSGGGSSTELHIGNGADSPYIEIKGGAKQCFRQILSSRPSNHVTRTEEFLKPPIRFFSRLGIDAVGKHRLSAGEHLVKRERNRTEGRIDDDISRKSR